MKSFATSAGLIRIGTQHEAFVTLTALINDACLQGPASVALSGGSTPKAYYKWVVDNWAFSKRTLDFAHWHVSDERCVPLSSDDSNFGNATRLLLDPLRIADSKRHPWPVDQLPDIAAAQYEATLRAKDRAYDICLLGLGDDAHTASLWPGCPLIGSGDKRRFADTEWPGRGHRLTVTEAGLATCKRIVVLAYGANKATALKHVVEGGSNAKKYPAQVLRQLQAKTFWFVDEAAAAGLECAKEG